MEKYRIHHNGKHFIFEGENRRVLDLNVHALMVKIKRLKIGIEEIKQTKRKVK